MKLNLQKAVMVALVALFSVGSAFAQNGTVKGIIKDKKSTEVVMFTNVVMKNKKDTSLIYGAATDVNGYYSVSKLPAGEYILEVSNIQYETYRLSVTVKAGSIQNRPIFLTQASELLQGHVVSATKQEAQTQIVMSMVKATKKEISAVPSPGEPDIARYFETVPGVITTGDQGGQMYVRGGSPVQNKVLLDGMIIYNPFHSIGFFSVFDTDIIRNADIYTGGFNAEYGGRISSVMDITTRDGNSNRIAGKVAVNPFGSKLLVEGPIKTAKFDSTGVPIGSSQSFILSGKTSYLEQSSKLLYSYMNDGEGLPFSFTDLYGKYSISGANGSKFNLFGFSFSDQVKYQAVSDLHWDSYGVGSNFVLIPGSSQVLIEGKFSYTNYLISLTEDDPLTGEQLDPRSSEVDGFNLGFDFKYLLGENEVKYGIEVLGYGTKFQVFNAVGRKINQDQNTTELAAYLSYKFILGRMIFEPSFRAQYYASLSTLSPEPRLGVKINATENLRFKLASGIYSQNVISANSDRDVVNLFYGFLSGPDNLQDSLLLEDGTKAGVDHALQKANHLIVGAELDLGKNVTLNLEGYYKAFTQLTNMNRNKVFDDSPENFDKPDVLKKDFIVETGDAMGVDMVVKYSTSNVYLWAVYSLGKVVRWDGIGEYAPIFDRRHNINLVGTYIFGEKENWEVGVRWNFGSGLPFTQTQGYYQQVQFQDIGDDYTTNNSEDVGIVYANLNEGRLPTYHRLDLSLKKKFELNENSVIQANFSVTNTYSRENIFYVDRISNEKVYQLPIMPSLGVSWTF
jgi:hypothetical protein